MAARIALLFVAAILSGVFLNLYYLVYSLFVVGLLGINNEIVSSVAYWVCVATGIATACAVLSKSWLNASSRKPANPRKSER